MDPERSARFRQILKPTGFHHKLRVSLAVAGQSPKFLALAIRLAKAADAAHRTSHLPS